MDNKINLNFESDLKRLEDRLDDLVKICNQLQTENKSLKEKQETLSRERATMVQKNEEVRARVEAMIVRLKSMEQGN
ncbi:MAG: TIGR02449 family protein [Woeseiaceae bacterium]|jgi:cell division protein ZapB|nr:TIGR02449 family protein [Woeseiaceae bacterium]|tara:strand:- start:916 stop:1146 length:231 start_codon:yes stop_codon:yes gene_type:complete